MVITTKEEEERLDFDERNVTRRADSVKISAESDIGSQLTYSIIPLLQSQPTTNLSKHDVIGLLKSIVQLEKKILDFTLSFHHDHISFFATFVALSANCIVINAAAIPKSQLQLATNGCSILLQYLLQALQMPDEKIILSKHQIISIIQGLCDDVSPLSKSDVISLCAIFKSAKIPSDLSPKQERQTGFRTETDETKEAKRVRLDHTCDSLVEQLITPILDVSKRDAQDAEKNIMAAGFSAYGQGSKTSLLAKNLFTLQQIGGANILLDFIRSLPTIRNHVQPVLAAEEGAPLKLPSTVNDAYGVIKMTKVLIKEYDAVWKILSLPILEPLTEDKLNTVLTIIHTCLYISLSLVTASSILTVNGSFVKSSVVMGATAAGMKDDSNEDNENNLISEIIDMSLEIYRNVMNVMKNSLRVAGLCYQNAHLFACWLLFSGIKNILNLTPSKSSKSDEMHKSKQGYTTLCIPLVSHVLKTLTSLLDDLKMETSSSSGIRIDKLAGSSSGTFKYNKFGCYSAWQRIEMLLSNINATQLLFSVASVSYRKCGMLRQLKHHHQLSHSTSTTGSTQEQGQGAEMTTITSSSGHISDIDDECCFSSDDSSRDEDSEPILGQLFKENDRDDNREQDSQRSKTRSPAFVIESSDKREPHKHLSLALQIFELFNSRFVCSDIESLRVYLKATLTDPQIVILSNIIKDIDRESALFSSGYYLDFSRTLSSFVHNLIATETLSTNYQTQLLIQLGVYPSSSLSALWPLSIPPRTLSVLAQILLLRQRKDTNELRSDSGTPCLFMWQSLVNHLKVRVKDNKELENGDDLNVEHAQLLLFIFHNLKLLQRKNVLLMVAQAIVEIAPCVDRPLKDYQIHFIGRILHFFEYMMKNLYEPPHALIEQIDNNLFKTQTLIPTRRDKDNNNKEPTMTQNKVFFSCRNIEENYNAYTSLNGEKMSLAPMKPRFYYVMNIDSFLNKDIPKLDGMALSFVLAGITETLEYDVLYDALMKLLSIGNQIEVANRHLTNNNLSFFGICAVQYTFNVAWRLFLQMPPSLKYLGIITSGSLPPEPHTILHSITWVPRIASNKWYYYWVRDAVTKLAQNRPDINPESLLKSVIKAAGSVNFSVQLLNSYVNDILKSAPTNSDLVPESELPKLFDIFVLECLIAKTMVTLDTCFNVSENNFNGGRREAEVFENPPGTTQDAKQGAAQLLPITIKLTTLFYEYIRWSILHVVASEDEQFKEVQVAQAYSCLLRIISSKSSGKVTSFPLNAGDCLPESLTKALDKWNTIQVDNASSSWRNDYSSASIPSEVFISNIENFHYNSLSSYSLSEFQCARQFSSSVKRVTSTMLKFAEEVFIWSLGSSSTFSNHHQSLLFEDFAKIVIPLSLDTTLDSFYGYCSQSLDAIWNNKESDEFLTACYVEVLRRLYDLLLKYPQCVSEKVLIESVKFMESLLDSVAGQIALEKFFCDADGNENNESEEVNKDIVALLKSAAADNLGCSYATTVLKFLTKLFDQTEKNPDTISLVRLCTSLSRLSNSDIGILQSWFNKILCTREENGETNVVINQENRLHLQNLTNFIVKESSPVDEDVANAFLSALLPMSNHILSSSFEVNGFPDLMIIMATLASAGSGSGHLNLVKTVVLLLETCSTYLSQKDVIEKLETNVMSGRHQIMMESCCYLLSYLADVFEALKMFMNDSIITGRASSPDMELGTSTAVDIDSDWVDDICQDEDESAGEESDEDSFCNKLCTFTVTQKEFMNQHWYHCHTCKMVDGVGVCTVCARVCHKDHDVTYAKYGSFFCDCGAKTDGTCFALVKRMPSTTLPEQSYRLPAYSSDADGTSVLTSSLRRRNSSPDRNAIPGEEQGKRKISETQNRHQTLARQLSPCKTEIINLLMSKNISGTVLDLLQYITPAIVSNCQRYSSAGCSIRARKELQDLHQEIRGLETSDQLMVPTLGSQEGAFENVRLNYSGEQGQTIRQLISTNNIRRVAMCALTSPYGKRQHLAVSHEKGKITLLQLAALLKQADSSKRKLTLTRLVSAPIPFTALSLAANPCNEDFLAVCGLKDCHVLTFNQSGHVCGHIVLHPQLEAGNYVIKSVWLPGSQTELALVTADFIKVYDLSLDIISPQYFFLLPSGKIRDISFVFTENGEKYVLIMSVMGYVYYQIMAEESAAVNGPFYVTSSLELRHPEIKETSGGLINCGGVSVYYSHTFQLVFLSYANGKSFIAPIKQVGVEVDNLFPVEMKSSNGSPSNSNGKSSKDASVAQPLCQWSEVSGHPGLVLAMCQQSNNPVVFMIKPDCVVIQKIKFLNIKAKITDMVALRHVTTPGEMRTTLILLCEDGSLRIYMASSETNYWLRPSLSSGYFFPGIGFGTRTSSLKSLRKKKSGKSRSSCAVSSLSTPVDFFEHCTALNDIEFGGNDVLHIYNTQQVKHRLNTTGLYIASTKPAGFTIEVYNNDPSMVMVGIRILLGTQDINRAPSCVDIFERSSRVYLTRSRWFDFAFTREESLLADKKLSIFFGVSGDANNVTMVDSIKVYGKTKESFSWPDDENEFVNSGSGLVGSSSLDYSSISTSYGQQLSSLDRLLSCSLEVLDGSFTIGSIGSVTDDKEAQKSKALEISTGLLTLPFPVLVQKNIKYLMLTLHQNRTFYNNHRDAAILNYVIKSLVDANRSNELDGEAFYRLMLVTRSIANSRPNNLIKFGECLTAAIGVTEQSPSTKEDQKDIEMTTFSSNVRKTSPEIQTSQSCYELSDSSNKQEQSKSGKQLNVNSTLRSVSFSEVPAKESSSGASFMIYLTDAFWRLYDMRPSNPLLPTVAPRGIVHTDATVQALVEIIHAFTLVDMSNIDIATQLYMKFFLCKDPVISFGAKQALVRVLRPKTRKRKVFIPSPPHCETPSAGGQSIEQSKAPSQSVSSTNSDRRAASQGSIDVFGHDNLIPAGEEQAGHFDLIENLDEVAGAAGGVDELMVAGQFAPLLDLPGDADDEAMVELAIALSLQDQQPPGGGVPDLSGPGRGSAAAAPPQRIASLEERGHFSDTTASAAASDDEGSTAATDGSTLRTSPVINEPEQVHEGSESGASGAESIVGEQVSGRSSAYGEDMTTSVSKGPMVDSHETVQETSDFDFFDTSNQKLHSIRIVLLEKLVQKLPEIREVGGLNCIPMMQVILMLTTDLDNNGERDKNVLILLLNGLVNELHFNSSDVSQMAQRSPNNEVKLIIMRLLSILMSRTKLSTTSSFKAGSSQQDGNSVPALCSIVTTQTLINSNVVDLCLHILVSLIGFWKSYQQEMETSKSTQSQQPTSQLAVPASSTPLKPRNISSTPDMSPFFLKQYVRSHGDDIFESYPQLLTDMVLRLPYQMKKISSSIPNGKQINFTPVWLDQLCDYMMIQLTPSIRKQVRKLLSFICGSKEKYRQIRDFHALDSHMKEVKKICKSGGFTESSSYTGQGTIITLSYDSMISLIEHLKACGEIASNRIINWQTFCNKDPSVLAFFTQVSFLLDEGVSPIVLQLLQFGLCAPVAKPGDGGVKVPVTILQGSTSLSPADTDSNGECLNSILARQLISQIDSKLLSQFIQCFLLESNLTGLRWQAHSLIYNLFKSFESQYQEQLCLLETMWNLWPKVPNYGRKAAQFVDLLGYFTLKINTNSDKATEYTEKALLVLRTQNKLLMNHPNSTVYNSLQSLVEFDGYYLESEPCLVCNNPEVNYTNMKLSSLKADSRFTTTTHIIKLLGSHTISKVSLRISDIKRSKMVKTLNLYYNNRAVHSVVELKNKTNIWHKAKRCNLAALQTEVKIEFTLPIIACNFMIEYADFYENIQASSETLQCPRCSASVAANPGVCGNCGENVFQCHKCRAINYDEKDPFLCNSCGFCKYAKFDYVLTAKATCAVDPIENEEDRKKTVQTINTLLEKADRVYKTLVANKPTLELLLFRIQEHGLMHKMTDEIISSMANNTSAQTSGFVNRAIQQVAQKYCSDSKGAFDELSKIIQKVLASRKELVDYDNRQRERNANPLSASQGATRRDSKVIASLSSASGNCYGCASATTEHCITLLKALATVPKYLRLLCESGLLKDLLSYNLRHGKSNVRQEVRKLLCTLTYDNPRATTELNKMIMEKVMDSFKPKCGQMFEVSSNVRHEIALLVCSVAKEDSCWEQRFRCVMKLFLMSLKVENPAVLESITVPCMKVLINVIKPDAPTSKKNKDKSIEEIATVRTNGFQLNIDLQKWLFGDPKHTLKSWKQRCRKRPNIYPISDDNKGQYSDRVLKLVAKFAFRWRDKVLARKGLTFTVSLSRSNWLLSVLFNRFSRTVRLMACSLVEALLLIPSRQKEIIDLLTSYLDELGDAGEFAQEFFGLYYNIIQKDDWKYYLAVKGVLMKLGTLITKEIDHLNELEETTLNSDLSEGVALKMLVDLLSFFMEVKPIKQQYKSRLVAFVLNGYLSLRKLVVQRTKIIEEAQDTLLELLEEMTTGTESETASFMAVCVDAINKCKLDDLRTPVFIFERLCSIIYPEENDTSEFFINLEKDPQQEDFLQGRMLGNPYSSNDTGMGPLMRDIKNKICQDCELVALLEDDSGMELLVRNKIISLDLSVKEVYKKVWCVDNNESDAMRVVYRMRGLMGDATEEFIQTLDSKNSQNVDNEVVYKMANVMSSCGGLQVMLQRLNVIQDLSARCRPLLLVLLKLFGHCVNVKSNRQMLIEPHLNAVGSMLNILKMFFTTDATESLTGPSTAGKPSSLEQLLHIMEHILVEASNESDHNYDNFCRETCGSKEDIKFLLSAISSPSIRGNNTVIQLVLRIIPLMTNSDVEKNKILLDHFKCHLNFNKFDYEHSHEDDFTIDCFCILVNGIENNANANRLKDFILENKVVADALEYLTIHAPPVKTAILANSDTWKEFTQRPALKYVLRILTGLSSGHEPTQLLINVDSIPIIHGLEQVSSDSHVGSLAEILLEVLLKNPKVAEKIKSVRKQTKEEKKKLAMGVRQKQLAELGMRANEKGQVTASSVILRQVEDLGEEQGLVCIICREGYKFQPTKVIGIYTFTKKCNIEPFDMSARKIGYSTVSHFNIVHVDCHKLAVRHARSRDEWDCATLQNANTKCNGILPLWGPSVQESAFASALAMHNNYLQECTGYRDIGYASTVHDLKLLLLKFASEESFSVDTGGGGHQSNIHLIPYLIHMALYVINTTRCVSREKSKLTAFLECLPSKWVEQSFETEGPHYWLAMYVILNPSSMWTKHRIPFLKRLIVLAQARNCNPKGCVLLEDKSCKDYHVYKASLLFFALIDGLYTILFKNVTVENNAIDSWPNVLADYIRNNDVQISETAEKLLKYYENDVLPCQSFEEYADVVGLLHEITQPNNFVANTLSV